MSRLPESQNGVIHCLWTTGVWKLFPFLLIYSIGFATLFPVIPTLITNGFASQAAGYPIDCQVFTPKTAPPACQNAHAQAVTWNSWTSFVSGSILSFLCAPSVGRLSDHWGRKPFIVTGVALALAPMMVLCMHVWGWLPIQWYYPFSALNGVVSSFSMSLMIVADRLVQEHRAAAIGYISASFSVGIMVGPILGGYISTQQSVYVCIALIGATLLYALLVLPETAPRVCKRRRIAAAAAHAAASGGADAAVVVVSCDVGHSKGTASSGQAQSKQSSPLQQQRSERRRSFDLTVVGPKASSLSMPASKEHDVETGSAHAGAAADADTQPLLPGNTAAATGNHSCCSNQGDSSSSRAGMLTRNDVLQLEFDPIPMVVPHMHDHVALLPSSGSTHGHGGGAQRRSSYHHDERQQGGFWEEVEQGTAGQGEHRAAANGQVATGSRDNSSTGKEAGNGGVTGRASRNGSSQDDEEEDRPSDWLTGWRVIVGSAWYLKLAIIWIIVAMTWEGAQDMLMQYLQLQLGFTTRDQAKLLVIVAVVGFTIKMFMLAPLVKWLGEQWLLVLGLTAYALQDVLLAIAPTKLFAFGAIAVGSLSCVSWPASVALQTSRVDPQDMGAVQGALQGISSLATGIGPIGFAALFSLFSRTDSSLPYMPQVVWYVAAGLSAVAIALTSTLHLSSRGPAPAVTSKQGADQQQDMGSDEHDEKQPLFTAGRRVDAGAAHQNGPENGVGNGAIKGGVAAAPAGALGNGESPEQSKKASGVADTNIAPGRWRSKLQSAAGGGSNLANDLQQPLLACKCDDDHV